MTRKKSKKVTFPKKKKKKINIDDIDVNKILVSKKEPYSKYDSLKYGLDIMIMMLLDHYV